MRIAFITKRLKQTEAAVGARRRTLYAINFFFAVHLALVSYYFAPFLTERSVPDALVGAFYILGAVVTLALLAIMPWVQRFVSNYALLLFASLTEIGVFIVFTVSTSLWLIIPAFAIYFAVPVILGILLDFLLEENTSGEHTTGRVRTFFITAANIGWIISPMVGGTLLDVGDFPLLFTVSAFMMVPFVIMALVYFRSTPNRVKKNTRMQTVWKRIFRNINLRGVFLSYFLLQFFYATVAVYVPLYLYKTMGFSYEMIGSVSAIMLIPFILIEVPAGKLADTLWGEREMLALGLLIAAMSTMLIGAMTSTSFLAWASILFITRIGAALTEAMSNSYFFKQVDESNAVLVTAFRSLSSFAYIAGPLLASALLFFVPMSVLFVVVGIIILAGIPFVLIIKDTR